MFRAGSERPGQDEAASARRGRIAHLGEGMPRRTSATPSERATMSEIAAAAGVSVPTVSRVVNGRPDVAPRTRRKIEELLRQRRYTVRRAASEAHIGLIDLVFVDLGNSWSMEILAGVEETAHRAGKGVVVS